MGDDRDEREGRRKSDRALEISKELRENLAKAKEIETDNPAKKQADELAIKMLTELEPEEENTGTRQVQDLLSEEQLRALRRRLDAAKDKSGPPEFATKPPLTRPTREQLAASRREPTPPPPPPPAHPTVPSPPPKMTPPRGGIPIPKQAYRSEEPRSSRPSEDEIRFFDRPVTFPPRPAKKEESPAPQSAPRVLVVDDDEEILNALVEVLAEEGYRVWRAENGIEALKRLYQMPKCDLILLDYMMKRMSGLDFLEVFDASPFSDIPLIFISAFDKPEWGREYDERLLYIRKPLDLDGLLEMVRSRIRGGEWKK